MLPRIVDTHIHLWDFRKAKYDWLKGNDSILNRTYAIDEISDERLKAGISEGLLVQAANNLADTEWMLQVAETTEWINGIVGWLPLTDPEQTQKLLQTKFLDHKYFKGLRHLIHDEADPKWLLQPRVIESLTFVSSFHLPYDIVGVIPEHIETAMKLSVEVPGLKMIFDHMNQPPIFYKERFGKWGDLMKDASANKNFFVKISGLGTTCKNPALWNELEIKPYIEFVLANFGVDRCMCGGDWPVSLLAGDYVSTWVKYRNVLSSILHPADLEKVFYSNAKLFYGL